MHTGVARFAAALRNYESGQLEQAEAILHQILEENAGHGGALHLLGSIAYQTGRIAAALSWFQKAVAADPANAHFHSSLGAAFQAQGEFALAHASHQRALALSPRDPVVLNNLGITLVSLRKKGEAVSAFHQALASNPSDPELINNLGAALAAVGRRDEAIGLYHRALALRPDFTQAHNNLGNALQQAGKLDEAIARFRRTLALQPDFAAARYNLGVALHAQGDLTGAQECYREALRLAPDDPMFLGTYAGSLNFDPSASPATLLAEHRRWGERHGRPAASFPRHDNSPDPERPLRIGYVSPDFRSHAVAFFLEPIIAQHARDRFVSFCYADIAAPDWETGYFRTLADQWRDTTLLTIEQLVALIRKDQIDILVELAGHTSDNRLLAFAHKPAPVQVSYLGYPSTTGLPAIDYRIGDSITDPPGAEEVYVEELLRLAPVFCAYSPPRNAPRPGATPARRQGRITFGSLHKLEKLNPEVLTVWCRILDAVPGSRLLMARHALEGTAVERFRGFFERHGVASERIVIRSVEAVRMQHLRVYDEIDISLDAFPWGGHTTACESLWMGVPVIALRGDRHAGRMVASILSCVGLPDLIAEDPDDYVRLAERLAGDIDGIENLRQGLRTRVFESPLCDGVAFTRGLEALYRQIWRRWCRSVGAGGE